MLSGSEIWEQLSYDLTDPQARLGLGQWETGRDRLVAVLRKHGFQLADFLPLAEAELAASPAHWLVIIGMSMEDGYSLLVVPETAIDDDLRAALQTADGTTIDHCADRDEPAQYAAHRKVSLAAGRVQPADCAPLPPELAKDLHFQEAELEALVNRWEPFESEPFGNASINTRITRIIHIFEWL